MFAKERQNKIYELIKRNGAATTAELTSHFMVSVETVRKDLMILEKSNLIKRVHGGAVAIGEMPKFLDLSFRNEANGELKRELSETAASFVENGDTIGIDSGSTAIYFAKALKERFTDLTVITASYDVFDILCRHADFKIILCGGEFMKSENTFFGPLTCDTLERLHVQKAFIFTSAVSLKYGIADFSHELYEVQRSLMKCGSSIFILADSSKFEKPALLKLDDMNENYTYITDSKLPEELKKIYAENGLKVITGKGEKQ